jgi:hypothetical protein
MDWRTDTVDGTKGSVVINGQKRDIVEGNLFLVSTKASPAKITQRKRDGQLKEWNGLETLAKEDPEVRKFIAATSERNSRVEAANLVHSTWWRTSNAAAPEKNR